MCRVVPLACSIFLLCIFPPLAHCDTAAASRQVRWCCSHSFSRPPAAEAAELACCIINTQGLESDHPSSSYVQLWKARRSLQQQQDALSNSDGCITSGAILKCEPGACATRSVMGVATWVCLR